MKTLNLLAFSFFIITQIGVAQTNSQTETVFENNLVVISTVQTECVDNANGTAKVYLLVKAQNKSGAPIHVSFKKNLWFDGQCISCDSQSQEYWVDFNLDPSGSTMGSCTKSNRLRIFVRMMNLEDVRQLTRFELDEIEITEL